VGFITDLPTSLIAAFRATLEEAMEADLLVHVRDIAHPDTESQAEDVYGILEQISKETGLERPALTEVWNKADALDPTTRTVLAARAASHSPPALLASALTGEGAEQVLFSVEAQLFRNRVLRAITLPAADGRARAWLHKNCEVASEDMSEDGAAMRLMVYMSDVDVERFSALSPEARIS
jgi:GTP-binding protein HflX